IIYCFFFSSRRRHTRFSRDWSSDVCSSDLRDRATSKAIDFDNHINTKHYVWNYVDFIIYLFTTNQRDFNEFEHQAYNKLVKYNRSEERRVGKECRYWFLTYHAKRAEMNMYH